MWVNELSHEQTALGYSDCSLHIVRFIRDENGDHSALWGQRGCLPFLTGVLFYLVSMVGNQVLAP